jgi:ribonuclease PH
MTDRPHDQLRPVSAELGFTESTPGSVLISMGRTRVLCTASIEDEVPRWMRDSGKGWVTAEYAMLPRATTERTPRERGGPSGRSQEIQRLIGRSLRAALDGFGFGEFTIRVDCDVLQADGGTRTASITGGCVALADAFTWLVQRTGRPSPIRRLVAGVSVGLVDGEARLDLSYAEDSTAAVDANVVMVEPDRFVEVQGTAEGAAFGRAELDGMLDLAHRGIQELFRIQRRVLGW